jgi:signal transduction histidine kinase
MRRTSLQAEVVLSLGLVMLAATGILAALLLQSGEQRLREWLGPGLLAEARALPASGPLRISGGTVVPGTRWWRVWPGRGGDSFRAEPADADPETLALAASARARGEALLRPGAPWDPIRFAVPSGNGTGVLAARLPAAVSLRLRGTPLAFAVGFVLLDVAIFTAFGGSLLRRRVVLPLQRLAAATRALADGSPEARVPVEGPREAAEVATAFNAMSASLAGRTEALEKAIVDLRETNTALRRARAGLDRAERLAAVGRLAAGVAHEVGNPMGAILAFLSLAERDPALSDETRAHLAKAGEQGIRVRRILRQLLDFSRPSRGASSAREAIDLEALARETAGLVRAQGRCDALDLEVERIATAPPAFADRGAVSQILLNLVLNAADAARSAERPRVRLEIRPAALALRAGEGGAAPAERGCPDAVECRVLDNGPGVDEEDRERIFDPFFTTKPPGEGTGLGLSNSLRLAEAEGGVLELGPAPTGWSTAFALRLPAAGGATARVRGGRRGERTAPGRS